jgi:succinate dehydrogenase / fumarate reductase iron-sulfur subunit
MQVDLRILRFDPERDAAPHWERYPVEAEPMDRVLTLLHKVKGDLDGTLTFRRSCGHGVCGSDAMLVNGRNRLACKIRVDQLGKKISVAPLPGLPVVKDLVVDMEGFFAKYRSVLSMANRSPCSSFWLLATMPFTSVELVLRKSITVAASGVMVSTA